MDIKYDMNAQEAREKTKVNHKNNIANQYGFAKDSIKEAVGRGKFSCKCEFHIDDSISDRLEDEGYIVFQNILGISTTISWDNPLITIK